MRRPRLHPRPPLRLHLLLPQRLPRPWSRHPRPRPAGRFLPRTEDGFLHLRSPSAWPRILGSNLPELPAAAPMAELFVTTSSAVRRAALRLGRPPFLLRERDCCGGPRWLPRDLNLP